MPVRTCSRVIFCPFIHIDAVKTVWDESRLVQPAQLQNAIDRAVESVRIMPFFCTALCL